MIRLITRHPELITYALLAAIALAMATHPDACLWHVECMK